MGSDMFMVTGMAKVVGSVLDDSTTTHNIAVPPSTTSILGVPIRTNTSKVGPIICINSITAKCTWQYT